MCGNQGIVTNIYITRTRSTCGKMSEFIVFLWWIRWILSLRTYTHYGWRIIKFSWHKQGLSVMIKKSIILIRKEQQTIALLPTLETKGWIQGTCYMPMLYLEWKLWVINRNMLEIKLEWSGYDVASHTSPYCIALEMSKRFLILPDNKTTSAL